MSIEALTYPNSHALRSVDFIIMMVGNPMEKAEEHLKLHFLLSFYTDSINTHKDFNNPGIYQSDTAEDYTYTCTYVGHDHNLTFD